MQTKFAARLMAFAPVCAMALCALTGCDNERQRTTESSRPMGSAPPTSLSHASEADIAADEGLAHGLYDQPGAGQPAHQPQDRRSAPDPASQRGSTWSIVLGTFSGDGHEQSAENMLGTLPHIDGRLRNSRIEQTRRGSMVVYGRFDGPDDPQAQRTLEQIKQIEMRGQPVFGRAFLTRVGSGSAHRSRHALMNVRERYPNVDPLYTLQVAVWGDFESGQLSPDRIREEAESYARQLRTEGFDAFVHHDDQQRISIVTVGLFDENALDPETGIMSRELRQLRERFSVHMVNGEPFEEPVDSRRPGRGTQPQRPPLVMVPMR